MVRLISLDQVRGGAISHPIGSYDYVFRDRRVWHGGCFIYKWKEQRVVVVVGHQEVIKKHGSKMVFYCMEATVLTAGLRGKSEILAGLPIHVLSTHTGMEAIRSLKSAGKIDTLVSLWDLPDMTGGELIRRIRDAKPWLPSIVLLDEPYESREPLIREVGVAAVLPSDVDPELFLQVVAQVLKVDRLQGSAKNEQSRFIGW